MEQKISFKRTISNIFFINKIIFKSSHTILVASIISRTFDSAINFFNGVLVIKLLLNMISSDSSFRDVLTLILLGIAINLVKILYDSILNGFYNDKVATKITKDSQRTVYEKAAKVKFQNYYNPDYYNNLSFTLNKIVSTVWDNISTLSTFVGSIVSCVLNVGIIMFSNNSLDSYILVIIMFIGSFTIQFIQFKINKMTYQLSLDIRLPERKRDYSRRMFYSKSFAKDFKCTDVAQTFNKFFADNNDDVTEKLIKSGKKIACFQGINTFLQMAPINIGTLIYLAYKLIVLKNISIGDFWAIYKGCNFIITSNIFSIMGNLHQNTLNIEKFREFLDMTEEDTHSGLVLTSKEKSCEIEFVNVSFKYENTEQYALKNINLKITSGERIALVGHNGAGKTTLTLLLLRLYEPCQGKILLNGKNINEYNLTSYRKFIAVTFQDYMIYPYSIAENVLLDLKSNVKDYPSVVKNSLKKCDIYAKIADAENGIDSAVNKEFVQNGLVLSGGEQQRLAISRLFSKESKIMILDEPSSALDPISEAEINQKIIEQSVGKTTVIVTHRLSTVKDVDKIYLMENGSIVESGSHYELIRANGKYKDLYSIQANYYMKEVEA